MSIGLGYASVAALRVRSRIPLADVWLATASPYWKLGKNHLLCLDSEGISEEMKYLQDESIVGKAGFDVMDLVSRTSQGNLGVNGYYHGLDFLLAMALGYERIRSDAVYESPSFDYDSAHTASRTGTTAAGTTGSTLVASASFFSAADVGNYVRIENVSAGCNTLDQVRRITAYTNATTVTISPAWITGGGSGWYSFGADPGAGKTFRIARCFTHQFEVSRNMHAEPFTDLGIGASTWATAENAANRWMAREGVLSFWKGVNYWTCLPMMVKALNLKISDSGLKVSAEIVARELLHANEDAQDKANWRFNPIVNSAGLSVFIREAVLRSDFYTVLMDAWSSTVPCATAVPISEFELNIDNGLDADLIVVGSQTREEPCRAQFRKITGSLTVPRYKNQVLESYCKDSSDLMAEVHARGGSNLVDSGGTVRPEVKMYLRRLKLTKQDSPISGPPPIQQKYTFQLLQPIAGNSSGMPAPSTGMENGEVIVQTINQNPYNAFMTQVQE